MKNSKKMSASVVLGILALIASSVLGTPRAAMGEDAAKPHDVVVFAAASLKETFEAIAKNFEAAHAGSHVVLQLAGSQELRTQIENGAKADVFASADTRHMSALQDTGLVGKPTIFARNEPVVITPTANPAGLHRFEDLPKAKKLIVGVDEVPIGRYTKQVIEKAGKDLGEAFVKNVEANVVSRELNVRQILAKVSLGEGDAGFVYKTDATTVRDKVQVIDIPQRWNVIAEYPIAVTSHAPDPGLAKAWVEMVSSPGGQKILSAAGFQTAEAGAAH
jgi:molybdate transport system substrate-binding protein